MNSFGSKFSVTIFGESHGDSMGVVLDGVKAGMELSEADFETDISRRKAGARGTTPRKESDTPHIVSGVFNGRTTGAPLTILFHNENTRSSDYSSLVDHPRPSHADFVAAKKFGGYNDYRGGGHFSGRITLGLVAAGVVAKMMLPGVEITSRIVEIGSESDSDKFAEMIERVMREGDSLGGVVEATVNGLPVGLGDPFFDSAESIISHLIFSIPAVKGVEFGNGFKASALRGSQNNDPIVDINGTTATNNAGGINGGITNGNPVVVRVAIKPTPSISCTQNTINLSSGKVESLVIKGRHDACIALRATVVVEAALAIAFCQF